MWESLPHWAKRAVMIGALAAAVLSSFELYVLAGGPVPNSLERHQEDIRRLSLDDLELKIPFLEDRIDRLVIRKGRFELTEQTPAVAEQKQAIDRDIQRSRRELKEAEIRREYLGKQGR